MLAGYSGYRPAWKTVPPCMAPGTENNTKKFQSAGKSVVYPDQPISRLMNEPRLTVSSDQSAYLHPGAYQPCDPRGVMAKKLDAAASNAAAPRKFCHKSAKAIEFPNFYEEKQQAQNLNPDDYRINFDRYAINGVVSVIDAVKIFGEKQVASAVLRFQNVFERKLVAILQVSLSRRNSESKTYVPSLQSGELRIGLAEVNFVEFSQAVQQVSTQLSSIKIGPSEPSELYAAKLDPKVITSLTENSRYITDLGAAGVNPIERGVMTGYGGMASTTNDLMYGTAKLSNQVPGYSGHIPKKEGMPTLQEPRTTGKNDIKGCFNANLPGYTGHWPTYGECTLFFLCSVVVVYISPLGTNLLCLLFVLAFSVVAVFLPGMTAKTEGVSVSIETTSGSSQSLAAALAVGGDWRAQINP
jgi:hypothetical protein